jgi:two-component system response regulator HydG
MARKSESKRRNEADRATHDAAGPGIAVPELLVDLNLPKVRQFTSKLRFAPNEGRIWLDERRMVLLHAEAFTSLREELMASLGVDTTRGLLTRIGYAAGCRDAEMAWKMSGSQASIPELMRTGAVLHALQGFVLPENLLSPDAIVQQGEDYYGEWIWKNSIEDEAHVALHGVGTHAVCWTEVGYSSGYLSTCLARRILVREIECRAMGHDYCRNVAKPVSRWEDAADDLRFLEPQPTPPTQVYVHGDTPVTPARAAAITPKVFASEAPDDAVVGASTAFHVLRHKILRVAPTNATVLLLGESGVGKSMVARDVHRNSRRAQMPWLEVNCAAIPEQLIESELFGVERGAYSGATASRPGRFEAADGGTLFLDEIGMLSMTAQGKLLRVLQNGELERLGSNKTIRTDVRVIAATNENLHEAVRDGRFREDLFFRLNVFPLLIQPLRERRDDIPLLAEVLLARFSKRHNRPVLGITARAMRAMLHHSWPGNIRELENVLERGVILAQDGEIIDLHHLFSIDNALSPTSMLGLGNLGTLTQDADDEPAEAQAADSVDAIAAEMVRQGKASLPIMEDALVRAAVKQADGNVSRAAAILGLTRAQVDSGSRSSATERLLA